MLGYGDGGTGLGELVDVADQHRFALWPGGRFVRELDDREGAGVGGHQAHEDGGADRLREVEGGAGQVVGVLHRDRVEHGQVGHQREAARVLLHHARVRAGIVGHVDHQPADDAGVRGRDQRVEGHVEARHLHGAERALPGPCRGRRDLERDLLVGAPFHVDAGRLHVQQARQRAGGWGAGVAGRDFYARVQRAEGEGFVAGEEFGCQWVPPKGAACCILRTAYCILHIV